MHVNVDMNPRLKTEKGELSPLFYGVLIPSFVLVVFPFSLAIILPLFFPAFQGYHFFSPEYYMQRGSMSSEQINAATISVIVAFIPSYLFVIFYSIKYGIPGRDKYFKERPASVLIAEYDFINKLFFAELIVLIIMTIVFYSIPESSRNISTYPWPFQGKAFYFIQLTLIMSIYSIFIFLVWSYYREDFQFKFAKKCIEDANNPAMDPDKKIYNLIAGLYLYKEYLKRSFDLQFDDTRVASNIISSSSDKNTIVDTIAKSFEKSTHGDSQDKLKPANCLSTFANLEAKEQFLTRPQLSTKIKEIITILTAVIPVLIAVIQFAFS